MFTHFSFGVKWPSTLALCTQRLFIPGLAISNEEAWVSGHFS